MTQVPATPFTDDQVLSTYYLAVACCPGAEYGEFFADLVAATGRPWREVAVIIGATEDDLVEGGVNLAECE